MMLIASHLLLIMSVPEILPVARLRKFCQQYGIDEMDFNIDGTIYHYINLGDEFQCYRERDTPTNYKY